jgi:hypothetical protein
MSTNYNMLTSPGWEYESGKARSQDFDNPAICTLKTSTLDCTDDQFAETYLDNIGGMIGGGFVLRAADVNNHYRVYSNTANVYFVKVVGGSPTFLGTPTQALSAGDTIRATAEGTSTVTLKFWINGSVVQTQTDGTSPLSGGQPGLFGSRNYNSWAFDALRFGDGDGTGGGGGGLRIADVGLILQVRRSRIG